MLSDGFTVEGGERLKDNPQCFGVATELVEGASCRDREVTGTEECRSQEHFRLYLTSLLYV